MMPSLDRKGGRNSFVFSANLLRNAIPLQFMQTYLQIAIALRYPQTYLQNAIVWYFLQTCCGGLETETELGNKAKAGSRLGGIKDLPQEQKDRDLFRCVQSGRSGIDPASALTIIIVNQAGSMSSSDRAFVDGAYSGKKSSHLGVLRLPKLSSVFP